MILVLTYFEASSPTLFALLHYINFRPHKAWVGPWRPDAQTAFSLPCPTSPRCSSVPAPPWSRGGLLHSAPQHPVHRIYELLREIAESIGIYACLSAAPQTPLNSALKINFGKKRHRSGK